MNQAGKCVMPDQCGCKMQDGSGMLEVNATRVSSDCLSLLSCTKPEGKISIVKQRECSKNARCEGNANGEPQCKCSEGYSGDGFICEQETKSTIETQTTRPGPTSMEPKDENSTNEPENENSTNEPENENSTNEPENENSTNELENENSTNEPEDNKSTKEPKDGCSKYNDTSYMNV